MAARIVAIYLVCYAVLMFATLGFYPTFSHPTGDEGTYLNYADQPWSLIGDFLEGYPPKEVMNPYNFRLFLTPLAVVRVVDPQGYVLARSLGLLYSVAGLWLVFRISQIIAEDEWAALATVLLSVHPTFVYLSHRVRPEALMILLVLCCLWQLMQDAKPPSWWRDASVGMLSMACLWVHYNGVLLPGVFLIAMFVSSRRREFRRRASAFAYGVLAVAVPFAILNLWPARESLRKFGWLPVTFSSSNRSPLLDLDRLLEVIWTRLWAYGVGVSSGADFDKATWPLTVCLLAVAVYGACTRRRPHETTFVVVLLAIATLLVVVIPVARPEYQLYLIVLLFPLVACGATKLSTTGRRWYAVFGFVALAFVGYSARDVMQADRWYAMRETNVAAGAAVASTLAACDSRPEVTVMACQEFYIYVPNSRFRTFHSVNETKSLAESVQMLDADVVVLTTRAYSVLLGYTVSTPARFPPDEAAVASAVAARSWLAEAGVLEVDPSGKRIAVEFTKWQELLRGQLAENGFAKVATDPIELNNEPVEIFIRQSAMTVRRNETRAVPLTAPSSAGPNRPPAQ